MHAGVMKKRKPVSAGYQLRRARLLAHLTTRTLAVFLGCSHAWITMLEQGKGRPGVDTAKRIEAYLGAPKWTAWFN